MMNTLEKLNEIFIEELENPAIKLTEATTANDIEEWDSLAHIQLVFTIEKAFNIRFTNQEITSFKSVGELVKSINNKVNNG